jgi:hypothetical protein
MVRIGASPEPFPAHEVSALEGDTPSVRALISRRLDTGASRVQHGRIGTYDQS